MTVTAGDPFSTTASLQGAVVLYYLVEEGREVRRIRGLGRRRLGSRKEVEDEPPPPHPLLTLR